MNGEQRADFTDAVVVIEHQPTTLGKVRHLIVKDIVALRMTYPFPLARALEVLEALFLYHSVHTPRIASPRRPSGRLIPIPVTSTGEGGLSNYSLPDRGHSPAHSLSE